MAAKVELKELSDAERARLDYHSWDALELALHDAPQEKKKEHSCKVDGCDRCGGAACTCDCCRPKKPDEKRDPLIIDLNRDGKVSITANKRYFDMDANGIAERVSWAASGDGFLVLDRDGDGKITSGKEMFGDYTVMSNGTGLRRA